VVREIRTFSMSDLAHLGCQPSSPWKFDSSGSSGGIVASTLEITPTVRSPAGRAFLNMEITKADWKARVPSLSSWFSKPGDSIAIIDNITITFYVLFGNYSSKGVFAHRCGCHFIDHKMTVCSEIEEAGPCQICERIRTMKAAGAQPLTFSESQHRRNLRSTL
jgi:hypothetical protein